MNDEKELEALENSINKTLKKVTPGFEITLNGDKELDTYGKGSRRLTLKNLESLKIGTVVWIDHTDCGVPRFNGPKRLTNKLLEDGGIFAFEDGSSFVTEVCGDQWDEIDKAFYACDHVLTFFTVQNLS